MGKKMWGVMFSAACLALAFGVGSLEAQPTDCEPCEKCDRDGDGLIKNSGRCRNLCNPDPLDLDPDDSDAGFCSGGDGGPGQTNTYDVVADSSTSNCADNAAPFDADTLGFCTTGPTAECGVGAPGAEISSGGVEAFNIFYCGGCFNLTLAGADGDLGNGDDIEIVRAASNMQVDDGEATQFGFTMYDIDGNSYESIGQIPVLDNQSVLVGASSFIVGVNQASFPVQISRKSAHGSRDRARGTICIGTLQFIRR